MSKEFEQIAWSPLVEEQCRQLVRLAVLEDLGAAFDWTTVALVPEAAEASAEIRSRQAGVLAGLPAAAVALQEMNTNICWTSQAADGERLVPGQVVATMSGSARDMLTAERLVLNLLGKLSGVATLTRQFVDAIAHTPAKVYDTRKTTPGWRGLEKYAVACGGGRNHRLGLHSAVLIKDNHLAFFAGQRAAGDAGRAVEAAREFLRQGVPQFPALESMLIEVEVDTLTQLQAVLPSRPDIVLLDNMSLEQLRRAVELRDQQAPEVQLEASGGVRLDTVAAIAETGVDRISAGALTHSAIGLDLGLDWR